MQRSLKRYEGKKPISNWASKMATEVSHNSAGVDFYLTKLNIRIKGQKYLFIYGTQNPPQHSADMHAQCVQEDDSHA